MKSNPVYFVTVSIVLLFLTAVWAGGLFYTVSHHQEWSKGAVQAVGWTLGLSGLSLLSVWGTWFTVGFRAMGAKERDL